MPFAITAERTFSAAHQLRLYDGSLEALHGHNWRARVTVEATKLDAIGVVMDFHELERLLNQILDPLHNTHLNDHPIFKSELNPSAENVAVFVADRLRLPTQVRLTTVEVWETPQNCAIYRPA
ncbi:MAG TPA: 6-carboxytetrahydropterin synthase [Tepidisphaeraceae bacterium]|jgi:6-pyruvoyltetrahydropterin/6-carboxytetrahydropterin synthase